MNRSFLVIGVLATTALLPSGVGSPRNASSSSQGVPSVSRCEQADLLGTYGLVRSGTSPQGPLAAVAIVQYDGAGNWTAQQTTSRNGTLTQGTFPGTYEIGSDCRGVIYDASGAVNGQIVLLDDGDAFFFLSVASGNTISGEGRRISPRNR